MKPTVGRIVYYKTRGSADGAYAPTDFAAIVTGVHEDGTLSLCTFGVSGLRFEVSVMQGDEPGQWNWMPFQRDQQKRVEAMADAETEKRESEIK